MRRPPLLLLLLLMSTAVIAGEPADPADAADAVARKAYAEPSASEAAPIARTRAERARRVAQRCAPCVLKLMRAGARSHVEDRIDELEACAQLTCGLAPAAPPEAMTDVVRAIVEREARQQSPAADDEDDAEQHARAADAGAGAHRPLSEEQAQRTFEDAVESLRAKDTVHGCALLDIVAAKGARDSRWTEKADNLLDRRCDTFPYARLDSRVVRVLGAAGVDTAAPAAGWDGDGDGRLRRLSEEQAQALFEDAVERLRARDERRACHLLEVVMQMGAEGSRWQDKSETMFLRRCD